MSNHEIEVRLKDLTQKERSLTAEIIQLIHLADQRKLYLEKGYSSLYDWLTKGFGYSGASAYRRIQAARMIRDLPEVTEKIESGSLNLSNLAKAQSFLQAEEKRTNKKISLLKKKEILKEIESKSLPETESLLFGIFPEAGKEIRQEKIQAINLEEKRLSITLSQKDLKALERAKELLSHKIPDASYAEIIRHLTEMFLEKKDPLRVNMNQKESQPRGKRKEASSVTMKADLKNISKEPEVNSEEKSAPDFAFEAKPTFAAAPSRVRNKTLPPPQRKAIKISLKREIWKRDQGCCQYRDPKTQKTCGSRHQIETDHIRPLALGGKDEAKNLRLLCRAHNHWRAETTFHSQRLKPKP